MVGGFVYQMVVVYVDLVGVVVMFYVLLIYIVV